MTKLLAALLFSMATLACSKASDVAPAPLATDPGPLPAGGPAPTAAPAPSAPAPSAPAPSAPAPVAVADDGPPDLVEAAPGVQVVADYDAPVFFNGGAYWRYNDGGWYSSSSYTGGWEYRATPPSVIVHLDRPERFVHYRPSGYVVRRRPAPQREWHPVAIHAGVRVEAPRAEVHVEAPRAVVHVEAPRAVVHVEAPRIEVPRIEVPRIAVPSVGVHVETHAEVHTH